ncbi:hypothetical protein CSV69_12150 [Sporosarcina sp. P26b]|uniref:hypothetical protein n=1 Tax=Sporosarcina sp. P26b TaxID=2048253 RepID=UPI000C1634BD|nr:hypothetical protein [Sporosarcina sp. P26b]PIC95350.1 hypothetical protein CSV69_12150 [Sporosarcina sp. P26b]
MKKKVVIGSILVLLIVLVFASTFLHKATEDPILAKRIEEQANSGVMKIRLSNLTNFDWDQAMVFGPYTSREMIEDRLDITVKGSIQNIDFRDDLFLLVFANGKYAVKTVELPRRTFDFTNNVFILTPSYDDLNVGRYLQ